MLNYLYVTLFFEDNSIKLSSKEPEILTLPENSVVFLYRSNTSLRKIYNQLNQKNPLRDCEIIFVKGKNNYNENQLRIF